MAEAKEASIRIDTGKLHSVLSSADVGCNGEVRFLGEVDSSPASIRLAAKLAVKYDRLNFC
jgi:hypothetical protein